MTCPACLKCPQSCSQMQPYGAILLLLLLLVLLTPATRNARNYDVGAMEDVTVTQFYSLNRAFVHAGLRKPRPPFKRQLAVMCKLHPTVPRDELLVSSEARVHGSTVQAGDVVFVHSQGQRCVGEVLLLFQAASCVSAIVSVWRPDPAGQNTEY